MINRLKIPFFCVLSLLFFAWCGAKLFKYFTYHQPPIVTLKGIDDGGFYARQTPCELIANNDYKISTVNVTLDGTQLLSNKVKARQFNVPFSIDTTTLPDGQHTLEVYAVDSSYHSNNATTSYRFIVDNAPLRATFLDSDYTVDQGKTLHMKLQANKKLAHAEVKLFATTYSFYPGSPDSTLYECFIPVDAEERPFEQIITTDIEDPVKNKLSLHANVQVKAFEFKKQKGFNVNADKWAQEKESGIDSKVLKEAMQKWLQESPKHKLWNGPFEYPIEVQRMTTPFGEIRMTPERGRYMHKGIDLINHPKCVTWAAQHGKVIIKDRFVISGNTVVLDHGLGVFTLYAHLEDFADINVGETIKKGSPLGRVGKTGYASGYHLHWELLVNNVSVDPLEWLSKVY